MSLHIKYDRINDNKEALDIDIVRQLYNVKLSIDDKYIKSDIKGYFTYLIELIVKQNDLENRAKNGFNYIKYPIYIDKINYDPEGINKYIGFMNPNIVAKLQQFDEISPIYKKINWLYGPIGLPIYDKYSLYKYSLYKIFPFLYKYKRELYSKNYKKNINEVIQDYRKYKLYVDSLNELINEDLQNSYQDFNVSLSTSSFHIPYYKEQNDYSKIGTHDIQCVIYYLDIKW